MAEGDSTLLEHYLPGPVLKITAALGSHFPGLESATTKA